MIRKIGMLFIVLGIAALLGAAGLLCFNNRESRAAMEASNSVLEQMRQQGLSGLADGSCQENELPRAERAEEPGADHADAFDEAAGEMIVLEIDGYGYIGYLSIPSLGLELPVMSEWDYGRLKRAPCRQFGSTKTNDLVIAAHNYPAHFGYLSRLCPGDLLTFTDMEAEEILYEVAFVDVLEPTAVDEAKSSDFDLVLYTCTYGGEKRVAVFCNRVAEEMAEQK